MENVGMPPSGFFRRDEFAGQYSIATSTRECIAPDDLNEIINTGLALLVPQGGNKVVCVLTCLA
jgi:hypothetical protein